MRRRGTCFSLWFCCGLVWLALGNPFCSFASEEDGRNHYPPDSNPSSNSSGPNTENNSRDIINAAINTVKQTQNDIKTTTDSIKEMGDKIKSAKTPEEKKLLEAELTKLIEKHDSLVNQAKEDLALLNNLTKERASVDPAQQPEIEKINKELKPIFNEFDKKRNLTDQLNDLKSQLDKARTSGDLLNIKNIEAKIKEIKGSIQSHVESGEKIGGSLNYSYENALKEIKTIEGQLSKLQPSFLTAGAPEIPKPIPIPSNPNPQQPITTPQPTTRDQPSAIPSPTNSNTETQEPPKTLPTPGHTFPNNPLQNSNPVSNGPDFSAPPSITSVPPESITPTTITNTTYSQTRSETRSPDGGFTDSGFTPGGSPAPSEFAPKTSQSPSVTPLLPPSTDQTPVATATAPTTFTTSTNLAVSNPTSQTVPMTTPGPRTINSETEPKSTPETPRAWKDSLSPAPTDQNSASESGLTSVDIPKRSSPSLDNSFRQMKEISNPTDNDVGRIDSQGTADSVTRILSDVARMEPTEKKPSYITELLKGGKLPPKSSEYPRGLTSSAKKNPPQKAPLQKTKPQTLLGMVFAWLGL